jgi:hypothetical protein
MFSIYFFLLKSKPLIIIEEKATTIKRYEKYTFIIGSLINNAPVIATVKNPKTKDSIGIFTIHNIKFATNSIINTKELKSTIAVMF